MTGHREPIAIVGVGGLFPGARTLDEFWSNIIRRVASSREVPEGRWPVSPQLLFDRVVGKLDRVYSLRGCYLDEIPLDLSGLNLDPGLVARLDPLFHLALHVGRRAFEDAGAERIDRTRTGVILANVILPTDTTSALTQELLGALRHKPTENGNGHSHAGVRESAIHPLNRYMAGLPAGLLARALGLGGGSMTLDAACASSLYAVKLACDELHAGRADAMLAGGVSRPDCLFTQMGFGQLRALSHSGHSRPLDARADGLVVGEGGGAFILKRLSDAVESGDRIYATIHGIGLSNDTGGSLLAPDSEGQLRAMRAAYHDAGWEPRDIDLVECHATGTPVGDATEIQSMKTLWGSGKKKGAACAIGSVKSNIGHLLTGAGAAGITKMLLAMREQLLPPTANFESPPPKLGLAKSPFRIQTEVEAWERRNRDMPRRAAVSAFGFGGINAHLLLQEWTPELAGVDGKKHRSSPAKGKSKASGGAPAPIAIVGMEARFGPFASLREFQEAVLSGTTGARSRPEKRWPVEIENACSDKEFLHRVENGAYLDELSVPLGKFRIPPTELSEMLPQQLLMLQAAAQALVDAGQKKIDPGRTGVFIGLGLDLNATNFHLRWRVMTEGDSSKEGNGASAAGTTSVASLSPPLTANRTTGALGGMVASRIAREFHFGGPSFTISAEENSGLRALEVAARALQAGELDAALVGAVDLAGDFRSVWAADALNPFSATGEARPFDESANGGIPGEGAVALVLKRLDDALAAGDRVYAVLRGIGSASSTGISGTEPDCLLRAMDRAQHEAPVAAEGISYIETNGSANPDEDRVEAEALKNTFKSAQDRKPLALGSVKPVIGHAGAASGLASLAKAALCLYQEIIPPLAELTTPRAELADAEQLFHAPHAPQYWLRNRADGPRRAAVSSMALDGTCVHAVLESCDEANPRVEIERRQPLGARAEALFAIEEESVVALLDRLQGIQSWAKRDGEDGARSIESVARNWLTQRGHGPEKKFAVALIARSSNELQELAAIAAELIRADPDRALDGTLPIGGRILYSPRPLGREGKVAFVFPGSGNQYVGAGLGAGAEWPEVLRRLDAENERLLDQFSPWLLAPWRLSWPEGWESAAQKNLLADHRSLIMGHVSHGAMMSDLVRSLGVKPDAVIGYSLGETAGYFATRAWTGRDEMVRRVMNSTLFVSDLVGRCDAARRAWNLPEGEAVDWRVAVVDRPAETVRSAMKRLDRVYLLIVNTPEECVIGGQRASLERLIESLDCNAFPLEGVSTVHCEIAMQVQNAYRGLHLFKTVRPAEIQFYGSGWGRFQEVGRQSAADSIVAQAIGGVDFPRSVEQAYEDGARIFVEMGPRGSCSRMIGRILGDRPHVARTACIQGQSDLSTILRLLGRLIAERAAVDLLALYGQESQAARHVADVTIEAKDALRTLKIPLNGESVELPSAPPEPPPASPAEPTAEPTLPFEPSSPSAPIAAHQPELELEGVSLLGDLGDKGIPPKPNGRPSRRGVGRRGAEIVHSHPAAALGPAMVRAQRATTDAHEAFLKYSGRMTQTQLQALDFQMALMEEIPRRTKRRRREPATPRMRTLSLPREACVEFARGKIADVLGERFAEVDTYPTRVRLPDEPLMLVDRIVSVTGEPCSLASGGVVTEHDVRPGGWYLDQGRMAAGVAIESGQADLFLSAYLGVDFATRGESVYRLLDAAVTFHRGLPAAGALLRYDIKIDRFIRQGDTRMFFFGFEATADGEPLMSMSDGCAGFFTKKQLELGKGIVIAENDPSLPATSAQRVWKPAEPMKKASYDERALEALRAGDLAGCFGDAFRVLPISTPLPLPSGQLALLSRVTELDPAGGRSGLGVIRAEIDIHPDGWFLACHFVGDPVMPGTLMYESCLQALRIYLMRMGWIGEAESVGFEPKPGVRARLRCRGQVIPSTKKAAYEITIKELGYGPEPFAIADAMMFADGRAIVEVLDISLRLVGSSREQIEAIWNPPRRHLSVDGVDGVDGRPAAPAPIEPLPGRGGAPLYDRESILQYCYGKPSLAFGVRYRPFDSRFIARLPSPPYLFLDRVVEIDAVPWRAQAGGKIITEYDVPTDAWFFDANQQENIPFSVILEIPLQACGWFAAYMGSALESAKPLRFRNLGGEAVRLEDLGRDAGTLTSHVEVLDVSRSAGMIIQKYRFRVTREGRDVYVGETQFGFFSEDALARQVGIRGPAPFVPSREQSSAPKRADLPDVRPFKPDDADGATPRPGMRLPARAYRMIDKIDLYVPDGGPHGLGFICGTKRVKPSEWFFKAHFFQDPVCPGSLGLEAFIQLLKVIAMERWGDLRQSHRFEPIAVGVSHVWTYRGQVIPTNGQVVVEAVIDEISDEKKLIKARGHLSVDGLMIYQMKDFAIRLAPV